MPSNITVGNIRCNTVILQILLQMVSTDQNEVVDDEGRGEYGQEDGRGIANGDDCA